MPMSKTAAVAAARGAVTNPEGYGTSWCVYGPYHGAANLDGPTTQSTASSFWTARIRRAEWVAELALELMGYDRGDAHCLVRVATETGRETTIAGILGYAIERLPRP